MKVFVALYKQWTEDETYVGVGSTFESAFLLLVDWLIDNLKYEYLVNQFLRLHDIKQEELQNKQRVHEWCLKYREDVLVAFDCSIIEEEVK